MVIHIYLQTLFAEYDLFVHECTEQGIPLTPEMLSKKWTELFAFYYGNELTLDEEVGVMWATFPHFYLNFYLYHYPTAFIASQTLAEQVLQGGEKESIRPPPTRSWKIRTLHELLSVHRFQLGNVRKFRIKFALRAEVPLLALFNHNLNVSPFIIRHIHLEAI